MRCINWLSAVLFASTITVVGFGSGTASAAPCCSAPICQLDPPPPICRFCNSGCAYEEYEEEEAELVCWLEEAE